MDLVGFRDCVVTGIASQSSRTRPGAPARARLGHAFRSSGAGVFFWDRRAVILRAGPFLKPIAGLTGKHNQEAAQVSSRCLSINVNPVFRISHLGLCKLLRVRSKAERSRAFEVSCWGQEESLQLFKDLRSISLVWIICEK
ncbi:hypothetical protein NDU88_005054 [Pleurodeles waltl]|uniref:Uncharacterized protein n=1 Tax=Pleurodeles waltl TaxID=8319 RepID=A0AAV7SKR0_PLEWA|nr:hypothetical protein NDU88_005054 [Pleurodeles waltl]